MTGAGSDEKPIDPVISIHAWRYPHIPELAGEERHPRLRTREPYLT